MKPHAYGGILVDLANPVESPAAKAYDDYVEMIINMNGLTLLQQIGWFTQDTKEKCFFCLMQLLANIWARLLKPFWGFPWRLANIIDCRLPLVDRQHVAHEVYSSSACCLDSSFTGPLRLLFPTEADLLSPKGIAVIQSLCSNRASAFVVVAHASFLPDPVRVCVERFRPDLLKSAPVD